MLSKLDRMYDKVIKEGVFNSERERKSIPPQITSETGGVMQIERQTKYCVIYVEDGKVMIAKDCVCKDEKDPYISNGNGQMVFFDEYWAADDQQVLAVIPMEDYDWSRVMGLKMR